MKNKAILLLSLLAASVFAAPAELALVKEGELPTVFRNEPPFIQNRICGELMASMARMSKDLFVATARPAVKDAAILAGARAMLFVKANAALTAEERTRAKRIADQIENSATPAAPAIKPFIFCEQRAQRWIQEGVVTPEDYRELEKEVRVVVDKSVAQK